MEEKSNPKRKSNPDVTRERLCCDYVPADISENKEDLTLIWLDESINKHADNFLQIFNQIQELNDYILLYRDPQYFIKYIESVTNEKILLILSHAMAETVLSCVHSLHTIMSIFIYSINDTKIEKNSNQYSSDVIICNDQHSLIKAVQNDIYLYSKQTVSFSLFSNTQESSFRDLAHNPASFIWFRILLDVFQQLPQTIEAKKQMIYVCRNYYRNNIAYLKQIKEFEETYQPSNAVHWYTRSGFIYKLMNKAFRIDDMYLLYLLRFYIIDLCKQIELMSGTFPSSQSIITLYRGRPIREEELEILKANIGQTISTNGFLSTTKDYAVAKAFTGEDNARTKSTLFIITIDQTKIATGSILAADIENISNYPQEKEVLFSIGSTFRIESVTYHEELKKWFVNMTATGNGLTHVQEHIDAVRKDLAETNPTRLFGKLLIDMGRYAKAEQYYQLVLDTLPDGHDDFPSLYHGLGYIHYVRGQYAEALQYDQTAYAIRKRTLPENHLDIARSSLNLGCDYLEYGDLEKARELLMEALHIRELLYSGHDHANIAVVLAVIGDSYTRSGVYGEALSYLKKALKMFKRVYPAGHSDITGVLSKLGYFYEQQGVYYRAVQYYHGAHKIASKIMLPEHPRLLKYFESIIRLYQKMNCVEQAVQFCEEKLSLQRELLGEQHPNIARVYKILEDLTVRHEQYLFKSAD